jgi:hypothetical protein
MKISQQAWDSMWENGSGEQQKMFDGDGNPLTTRDVKLLLLKADLSLTEANAIFDMFPFPMPYPVIWKKGMWKKIKAEDAVI